MPSLGSALIELRVNRRYTVDDLGMQGGVTDLQGRKQFRQQIESGGHGFNGTQQGREFGDGGHFLQVTPEIFDICRIGQQRLLIGQERHRFFTDRCLL